ncbi:MAG: MBL fold metallo-hydrolase [Longimicrobiales bacterium]
MTKEHAPGGDSVVVRYWGTRGSIPSPGPETVVFGGNTPCVEVQAGGSRWILDSGTGIRNLGAELKAKGEVVKATVLLSHYHWDHIQGLPFFSPVYSEGTELRVFGPAEYGYGVREMLEQLMGRPNFPVDCDHVQAEVTPIELTSPSFECEGAEVSTYRMRHGSATFGFRLDVGGRSVCYVPDNELVGGSYGADPGWRAGLEEFIGDADLLIHDAMFVAEEYERVEGWGHSTVEHAIELAQSSGVKRLVLFHHAPDRSDSTLIDIVSEARRRLARGGTRLKVWAAREGETDVL